MSATIPVLLFVKSKLSDTYSYINSS